jgi:hypothetical protein
MKERHTTKKTVILPLIVLMSSLLENLPVFLKPAAWKFRIASDRSSILYSGDPWPSYTVDPLTRDLWIADRAIEDQPSANPLSFPSFIPLPSGRDADR